jgi:hypothetical protein
VITRVPYARHFQFSRRLLSANRAGDAHVEGIAWKSSINAIFTRPEDDGENSQTIATVDGQTFHPGPA